MTYNHTKALTRHGGAVCRRCEGCGITYTDIYGDWEILRTIERECEDCGGTGWSLTDLNRNYKATNRHTIHRLATAA